MLSGIVATEVEGTVSDDSQHRDGESLVKSEETIGFVNLGQTVKETVELALAIAFADVGGQTGSGKVQGVNETEGSGTSSTTRGQVSEEEFESIGLGVEGTEIFLEGIFEGEVQGLGREISDHVGEISSV